MEISLDQLLAARDQRATYLSQLMERCPGACIAVFTLVTPGPVKRSAETARLFDAGVAALARLVTRCELMPLAFESFDRPTGEEAYLAVKTDPGFFKMELCKLEESVPYGRLWDMDVVRPDGARVCRADVGFRERGCIVCGKAGRACASRRLHPMDEVLLAARKLISTLPGEP
jgi:holo-ACP synthase CitX